MIGYMVKNNHKMKSSCPKQSKPRPALTLKQRYERLSKLAKQAFKVQHGNVRKVRNTTLTDQQMWHYVQK